jgi:hypothetical protein
LRIPSGLFAQLVFFLRSFGLSLDNFASLRQGIISEVICAKIKQLLLLHLGWSFIT